MAKDIYIYGAGGHAKVVAATARLCGYVIRGFWEDSESRIGTDFFGSHIIAYENIPAGANVFVAFGDNEVRFDKGRKMETRFHIPTLIHPSAQIAEDAKLEEGCYVGAFVNLDPACTIGAFSIINKFVNVSHDAKIGNGCHVSVGSIVAGNCIIDDFAFLGIGTRVIPHVHIGSRSIIGAGAVVVRDIESDATAVGCPARIIKRR